MDAEKDAFEAAAFPPIQNVFEAFGKDTAESLGVAFNLRDENVAADLLQRSNRLRGVVDTTWAKVQVAIVDGEAEGETIDGIAKRIGKVFEQGKGYRSRVIARTETVGAMNSGSLRAATQSGVVEQKIWLAARDHRTRSTHITADGQAVDVDKKFAVGGSRMSHPGDPAGGPSEVVNCRCSMVFKRTEAAEVEAEVEDQAVPPEAVEQVAAIRTLAETIRATKAPLAKKDYLDWSVAREANLRDLGRQIREEALTRVEDVDISKVQAAVEDLTVKARANMDELWKMRVSDFGSGVNQATGEPWAYQVKPGEDRYKAYKALRAKLEKERKAILAERARVETASKEARGRAALEVLKEVREMGTDPKSIAFEAGSSTEGKKLVQEMSEWFPSEWWSNSTGAGGPREKDGTGAFLVKVVEGRAGYTHQDFVKSGGTYKTVSRLTTGAANGNIRSTTVHELSHRMEHTNRGLTEAELRFWRRRTDDGKAAGGIRRYKHGGPKEVVNEDAFGDEYMGKSYLDRHSGSARPVRMDPGGGYVADDLDSLEWDPTVRTTSWEVLSMGMEEVAFDVFGSWDRDPDYIDFVLGLLGGF